MKTLVETTDQQIHAIINSNTFVKYADVNTPVWHDEKSGLAKTENSISNIHIFEHDKSGNVKMISISIHTFNMIAKQVSKVIKAKTAPDFPEY